MLTSRFPRINDIWPTLSPRSTAINLYFDSVHPSQPDLDAPLDCFRFPTILATVLKSPESWIALRGTNRALTSYINALLYHAIEIKAARREHWNAPASFPNDRLRFWAVTFDFAESGMVYQDTRRAVLPWLDPRHPCGGPLVTVNGCHGRLPLFPPRRYYWHGRPSGEYLKQQGAWSRLLEKNTKIVDYYTESCSIQDLDDALERVEVMRMFVTTDTVCLVKDNHPPFTNFKTLILVPKIPFDSGIAYPILRYLDVIVLCKVVVNVDWSPKSGPLYPRIFPPAGEPRLEPIKIVFIFRRMTDAEEQSYVEPGAPALGSQGLPCRFSPQHIHRRTPVQCRWDLLILDIVLLLCAMGLDTHVRIALVDAPDKIPLQEAHRGLLAVLEGRCTRLADFCRIPAYRLLVLLQNLTLLTHEVYAGTISREQLVLEKGGPIRATTVVSASAQYY